MITSNEIGKVFGIMRASYGHLWPHEGDAVEVWFRKLNKYTEPAIMKAANAALKTHPDRPPTLPQFDALCYSMMEPDYKILPPPKTKIENRIAQIAMLKVIIKLGGVHTDTLKQLIALKDALVNEYNEGMYQNDFPAQVEKQLKQLGEAHDADRTEINKTA